MYLADLIHALPVNHYISYFDTSFGTLIHVNKIMNNLEKSAIMWGLIIMWFFIWIYIARNFEQILDGLGMKHTPRKIQAEIDPLRKWKFTNTRTSLIHSLFTGLIKTIDLLLFNFILRYLGSVHIDKETYAFLGFKYI